MADPHAPALAAIRERWAQSGLRPGEPSYTKASADIPILLEIIAAQAARLAHTGTYCAFCTAEFPDEAPDTVEQIQRHVYVCPLHPMRQVERDRDQMDSQATRYRVALEAQAARLAAVMPYVDHLPQCDGSPIYPNHCTCGLNAILEVPDG